MDLILEKKKAKNFQRKNIKELETSSLNLFMNYILYGSRSNESFKSQMDG